MTNKEYYKEQIFEIACKGETIAFDEVEHKMVACDGIGCRSCKFGREGNCRKQIQEWLEEEYAEDEDIDWSKVEVDTKILVRNDGDKEWEKRYFSKYENGKVYAFTNGLTSWTVADSDYYVCGWEYAKLYNEGGDN